MKSEKYDYEKAVKQDVMDFIEENINLDEWEDEDALREYLQDTLWEEDSVTGNASGSYTFSTYKAEEYLCHNWDLLYEALEQFGRDEMDVFEYGAEWCDVLIRCYLLNQIIDEVVCELYFFKNN